MAIRPILTGSVFAAIIAALGFIIYCNADLLMSPAPSQQAANNTNAPHSATPTATSPQTNDADTPVVYAELGKRLEALRKK